MIITSERTLSKQRAVGLGFGYRAYPLLGETFQEKGKRRTNRCQSVDPGGNTPATQNLWTIKLLKTRQTLNGTLFWLNQLPGWVGQLTKLRKGSPEQQNPSDFTIPPRAKELEIIVISAGHYGQIAQDCYCHFYSMYTDVLFLSTTEREVL